MATVQQYLGRFTLRRLRSSTSFATLYEAVDSATGRVVALKIFSHSLPDKGYERSGVRALHQRLTALGHPHILPVLESGSDDAGWMTTEFMPAGSLKDRLANPMKPEQVADVLDQVGSALDAAHAQGILHGDLKPANILIDKDGRYLVADFGQGELAAQAPAIVRLYASTPYPSYMSPEQASEMSMTPKSDVYALGILAYQLLTGATPYSGTDAATVAGKQARGEADDPREYEPKVPAAVAEAVLTALARNPECRYASCAELAKAFRSALEDRAPAARPAPSAAAPAPFPPTTEGRRQAYFEDLARVCWSCGHKNPEGLVRCESCWSLLNEPGGAPKQDAPPLPPAPRFGEKSRSVAVLSLGMVTAVLLSAFLPSFEPVPQPTSAISAMTAPGTWTTFQANNAHTGAVPGPAPSLAGQVKWELKMPAPVLAPPVVSSKGVYLGTGDARVLRLDPQTGAILRQIKVNGPVNAAPTLAGGLLYVGLRDGHLLALDEDTLEQRWDNATGGSIYGGMTVDKGSVYVGNGNGEALAIDAESGKTLWRYRTRGWVSSIPSVTESGLLLVGSSDGNAYALKAATGELVLKHRVSYAVDNAITVRGNVGYIARDQGAIVAIDLTEKSMWWDDFVYWSNLQLFVFGMREQPPQRRAILWRLVPGQGLVSSIALADDIVYMVTQSVRKSDSGALHALDINEKKKLWSYDTAGHLTPSVVGDTVYVSSTDGRVSALDRATGKERLVFDVPGKLRPSVPPVVAGQTLYAGASTELAPLYVQRRDAKGELFPDQSPETPGDWYFFFGGTYCDPRDTPLVGPFPNQRDALTAGYNDVPSCGVLFALK